MLSPLQQPVVRAALISCSTHTAGDVLCQSIRARAAGKDVKINWQQTLRFGVVGLTLHGPYFYNAFRWLDGRFGTAATFQRAAMKGLAAQVTIFPIYLMGFFAYMGVLEGLNPEQCISKVQHALLPTLVTGSFFWPVANLANFMYVPPAGRVVFANAAGLLWNSYLSFANSTRGAVAPAAAGDSSSSKKRN